MSWIRKLIKYKIYFLYLIISTFLLLEIIFHTLPVTESSKLQKVDDMNKVLKYKSSITVTKQRGFKFKNITTKKINDAGYYSDEDFFNINDKREKIAIIGDSMVAAAEVENHESLSGLLMKGYQNTKFFTNIRRFN